MKGYLLDTCVISELVKKRPEQRVLRWLSKQDEERLFLSVLTIGELVKGACKLNDEKRRGELMTWIGEDLCSRFFSRIIEIDQQVARVWGRVSAASERTGRPLPTIDSLLTATALANQLTLVTRNVKDVETTGVMLVNPWP